MGVDYGIWGLVPPPMPINKERREDSLTEAVAYEATSLTASEPAPKHAIDRPPPLPYTDPQPLPTGHRKQDENMTMRNGNSIVWESTMRSYGEPRSARSLVRWHTGIFNLESHLRCSSCAPPSSPWGLRLLHATACPHVGFRFPTKRYLCADLGSRWHLAQPSRFK